MSGIFYGIGVGPGDPELLTVKAINAIKAADVLIAPKTEKKEGSVALSIAKPYLRSDIEIVYQVFPMVKNFADSTDAWEANKKEILSLLEQGKNVAFLTLGDPMFYSTYIYVYRLLKDEDVKIVTIPGIPAFCAIGSQAGIPIVEGNDVLSIIPATASPEKIEKAIANCDNAVLMKVYKNFPEIADVLDKHDMAKNAVMLSRCGLPDEERIDDIMTQKDKKVNYLSTILTRK
ncbi:MAG: precorrin-2 C(20)-methyltransferase [Selenomonadaceae bacterium]|nr:precorrin-2 C(20)-methyltransferase [Selenomonadaceae bacterium]MEE1362490.1 precorrin-2 C(20)-methyltransferase [Selenomonadaceae bacterium]